MRSVDKLLSVLAAKGSITLAEERRLQKHIEKETALIRATWDDEERDTRAGRTRTDYSNIDVSNF